MLNKNLNKYWHQLETKYSAPRYVKKIKNLEFVDLKNAVENKKEICI